MAIVVIIVVATGGAGAAPAGLGASAGVSAGGASALGASAVGASASSASAVSASAVSASVASAAVSSSAAATLTTTATATGSGLATATAVAVKSTLGSKLALQVGAVTGVAAAAMTTAQLPTPISPEVAALIKFVKALKLTAQTESLLLEILNVNPPTLLSDPSVPIAFEQFSDEENQFIQFFSADGAEPVLVSIPLDYFTEES